MAYLSFLIGAGCVIWRTCNRLFSSLPSSEPGNHSRLTPCGVSA
nr:MAG TPA: hypothetical protein [Bacteriophage sp.]